MRQRQDPRCRRNQSKPKTISRKTIELFGQEAQGGLQIHAALVELESLPDSDRHSQLIDAVVRGITSLGGSAATVSLPDVERATFALLPFIETIKDRTTATKQDFSTVREHFRTVIASVKVATGITLDIDPLPEAAPAPEPVLEFLHLLNALHQLRDEQAAQGAACPAAHPAGAAAFGTRSAYRRWPDYRCTVSGLLLTIHNTDAQYLGRSARICLALRCTSAGSEPAGLPS